MSIPNVRCKEEATCIGEVREVSWNRRKSSDFLFVFTRVSEFMRMKSRDHIVRLKRFQVEERRRRVQQIEAMIADFHRMATDLDREIANEEARSGISDPNHFAYPTYARAAAARRDNLKRSAEELKEQAVDARGNLELAVEEFRKAESLEGRDKVAERAPKAANDFPFGLASA